MSWLFSQALVGEYLGDISSDGEQSVQLNGNHTQQAYCAPDKMTDFSRLSRFGMTYKPLTENLGEELLTSYLAAFHAKTSPQREKAQESTESEAECGEKWHGSFAKYDQDLCLWKTHQCLLLGDLESYSETWPQWGLMRDGECWEQQTLAHLTNETEYGFWPTPTASMMPCEGTVRIMRKAWQDGRVTLEEASVIAGRDVRKSQGKVPKWPTPDANMGNRGTQENWVPIRKSGQPAQYPINQALRDAEKKSGKPNPVWIEWLMGWPMGWTDLKPLEMDKFQRWLKKHGKS
jgi:hypothetical protein